MWTYTSYTEGGAEDMQKGEKGGCTEMVLNEGEGGGGDR